MLSAGDKVTVFGFCCRACPQHPCVHSYEKKKKRQIQFNKPVMLEDTLMAGYAETFNWMLSVLVSASMSVLLRCLVWLFSILNVRGVWAKGGRVAQNPTVHGWRSWSLQRATNYKGRLIWVWTWKDLSLIISYFPCLSACLCLFLVSVVNLNCTSLTVVPTKYQLFLSHGKHLGRTPLARCHPGRNGTILPWWLWCGRCFRRRHPCSPLCCCSTCAGDSS